MDYKITRTELLSDKCQSLAKAVQRPEDAFHVWTRRTRTGRSTFALAFDGSDGQSFFPYWIIKDVTFDCLRFVIDEMADRLSGERIPVLKLVRAADYIKKGGKYEG